MATTTRVLDANVNGTVYTSNANGALEALDTCHSGATAPTDEVANGKLWLDTSTTPGVLKIYNNATWEVVHSGTVDINGGTIDGAVIGGTTPAAVTGTTLTATGAFTSLGIDDNAAATAVTIAASGDVGIGTSAPSALLDVLSASNPSIKVRSNGGTVGNYAELTLQSYNNFSGIGQAFVRGSSSASGNSNTDLVFGTNAPGFGAPAERMRITSSGNVGIGTSSPAAGFKLDVNGAFTVGGNFNAGADTNGGGVNIGFDTSTGGSISALDPAVSWYPLNIAGSNVTFGTFGTENMRLDGNGGLLVGTTTSLAGLGGRVDINSGGGRGLVQNISSGVNRFQEYLFNGNTVGFISTNGSSTTYSTTSDYRLKENVTPVQGAADIVKAMRPVTYTYRSDGSWMDGFLAHELQELHPRAVTGSKDAMRDEEYEVTPAVYEDIIIPAVEAVAEVPAVYDEEGVLVSEMVPAVEAQPECTEQRLVSEAVMGTRSVPDYQGVDYSKLTPILTAALQEALNKIDALEARVVALEP